MDNVSEQRLSQVHPQLAAITRQLADGLAAKGIYVRVVEGLRTWEEQDALYAQGRTTPGKIVTNAAGGSSYHNYGQAVDLVPSTAGPESPYVPNWNPKDPSYKTMQEDGEDLGLTSGARWITIPDPPHFQLTGTLPVSPDAATKAAYQAAGGGDAGIKAVWKLAGMEVPN
jgi:peptidoglycan L-alanyl-D-glutamate endopeptidase CwlK